MPKRTARLRFNLVMEIAGKRYECSDATLNFALNRIPTATASLAVGRDTVSLERALVHDMADNLNVMLPVKLIFNPSGDWAPEDVGFSSLGRWGEVGEQVIFDGYLTGGALRKQRGVVRFHVGLVHWLSDLSFSSALSNQSHPGNPARFRWRSVPTTFGTRTGSKNSFVGSHVTSALFTSQAIQTDLWSHCLHPFFWELSGQDVLQPGLDACSAIASENDAAKAALRRLEVATGNAGDEIGKPSQFGAEGGRSPYYRPLAMELGFIERIIASSISQFVGQASLDSYFSSTIWDKLVGVLGPAFYFVVVPRVHTAIVAPFVPGLRQTFGEAYANGKSLDVKEITYLDNSSALARPLRAVGIILPGVTARTNPHEPTPIGLLGGCFAVPGRGMISYQNPPAWLAQAPYHAYSTQRSAQSAEPGSSTTPSTLGDSSGNVDGDTPIMAVNKARDYYARVAHYMFAQEALRGRSAIVQGKLRFDLAPGTTIAMRNQDPLFLPADQLSNDYVGTIMRIGISMNAEDSVAGTTFQLEHVRTASENANDRYSIDSHPLYKNSFTGAPLLHDYLFGD